MSLCKYCGFCINASKWCPEGWPIVQYICSIHPCLNMSTCHLLQKVDTLANIFPTHPCLNMWFVYLTPALEGRHITQYVPYIHVSICRPVTCFKYALVRFSNNNQQWYQTCIYMHSKVEKMKAKYCLLFVTFILFSHFSLLLKITFISHTITMQHFPHWILNLQNVIHSKL